MRRTQLSLAGSEEGGRGCEARKAGSFWKLRKARKGIFPWSFYKAMYPADTLILAYVSLLI